MEKNVNTTFSSRGVVISNIITCIIVGALWFFTRNLVVVIAIGLIASVLVAFLFNRNVTTRGKVSLIILLVLFLILAILFFGRKTENPTNDQGDDGTVEIITEEEEDDTDEICVDDQTVVVDNSGWSAGKGSTGGATVKPGEILTPSYSNTGGGSKSVDNDPSDNVTVITSDKTPAVIVDPDQEKEVEDQKNKAKGEGKDVIDMDNGIVAIVDNTETEEDSSKDESNKVDLTEEEKKNAVEIPSGEESDIPDTSDNEESEAPKEDDKSKSDKLSEMEEATRDESTTNTTAEEENEQDEKLDNDSDVSSQNETNDNDTATEEVEENEQDDESVEVETTPVSISALDGNSAIAGDSVQFKVSGDVKSVEGLDGLNYTFSGGYITVNTEPDVATVITPVVIGVDGSTATASVTISALN